MAVTLNASTSSGFIATSDTSGVLELQNNGTTRMTVNSSGVSFAAQPLIGGVAPPAFSAYQNATTSVAANAFTKVNFQVEEFDTANCFASSRFTANIAGYYLIGGATNITNFVTISIFKNGSEYKRGVQSANNGMYGGSVNGIVYMNGSTDYVEIYVYQSSGTQTTAAVQAETWFNGCLMRAA